MINHGLARAKLAQILGDGLPQATVQRAGIESLAVFPSVIVGQPAWQPQTQLTYAIDRSTFPIAVVVNRAAAGDNLAIDDLEDLWPQVVRLLKTASETDQTLDGICDEALVTRADFGAFQLQGQSYPAQLIFIELYG